MQNDSSEPSLPYVDIVDVLRRRFPIILLGSLAGLVCSVAYICTARVRFESQAVVLVAQKDARVTTGNAGELGVKAKVDEELLATHIQLLTSPVVILSALQSKGTDGKRLFELPSIDEQIPAKLKVDDTSAQKGAVAYITENLSVSRGGGGASKNAQVLRVKLQHADSEDCQTMLDAIIGSYQVFLEKSIVSTGNEAGDLIKRASDELEAKVALHHKLYSEFLHDAPMLWNYDGDTLNPHQMQVSKLEAVLSEVRLRKSEVQSRLNLAESVINDPDQDPLQRLTVFDAADVQRLALLVELDSESFDRVQSERSKVANVEFGQLLALNLQAQTDSLKVGANHPKYRATRKHIDGVKQFLEDRNYSSSVPEKPNPPVDLGQLVVMYRTLLNHDLAHAEQRERELIEQIADAKAASKEMIAYELEESRLRRKLERSQSLYEAVVDRLREVTLATGYGGFITELISAPEVGQKCWPKIPLLVLLGGLLGTLAGVSSAVVVEVADKSFKNQQDIERDMDSPVLAHLPKMQLSEMTATHGNVDPVVATLHRPKARFAESIRNLRTSVFFETKDRESTILQVTSPNACDGKSTVAANLAVAIAQTNKRVMLIECDLRRPALGQVFGLKSSSIGMSSILGGDSEVSEAIQECTAVPTLFIIQAGAIPENPSELLSLSTFRELLASIREEYDFVILDSPPVGPVSDPVAIASEADFVLITLSLSDEVRADAKDCVSNLRDNGGNILGVVVNNCGSTDAASYKYRQLSADNPYYTA